MDEYEAEYREHADRLLAAFQADEISFHEWNRRQRECCERYFASVAALEASDG